MSTPSAPERIGRDLTRAILRGTYRPGTHLPTLRHLAADYGVNPATMQRALARLEVRGLVTARQGSGLRVNDPVEVGDLSLVPDLLDAFADDPDRSAAILEDLLEVRRVLAVRLMVRHLDAVATVLDDLEAEAPSLIDLSSPEVWVADLAIARRILAATGNTVVLALLASIERALSELPVLVEAMFEEPDRNLAAILGVAAALRDGDGDGGLADRLDTIIGDVDRHTVAAYRRRLTAHG